jgi:hypothetical protein
MIFISHFLYLDTLIEHFYCKSCWTGKLTIRSFPNHGTVSGKVEAYYPDQGTKIEEIMVEICR